MSERKEIKMTLEASVEQRSENAEGRPDYGSLREFFEEESGQDQIEYVLVAALLSLSAVATLKGLATDVTWLWQNLSTSLASSI